MRSRCRMCTTRSRSWCIGCWRTTLRRQCKRGPRRRPSRRAWPAGISLRGASFPIGRDGEIQQEAEMMKTRLKRSIQPTINKIERNLEALGDDIEEGFDDLAENFQELGEILTQQLSQPATTASQAKTFRRTKQQRTTPDRTHGSARAA